jgi:hypothetical protein
MGTNVRAAAFAFTAAAVACAASFAIDEATARRYAEIDARVAAIVANMTLVQKAKQVWSWLRRCLSVR